MNTRFAMLAASMAGMLAAPAYAYYPAADPNNPDPNIGSISFHPEQYPPGNHGFVPTYPAADGTDVYNGRDSANNRVYVFDDFSSTTTVGSAQPHFWGAWQGGTGTITALHIQLYADDNGDFGRLLYAGTYSNSAVFKNGPSYTGASAGPAVDPAYDRNRDFGVRNDLYGDRYWFDGTTLSAISTLKDLLQIATTPGRAGGPTCCGPLPDNSTFWIGFSVDTTGGLFGAATNYVPTLAPASLAPVGNGGDGSFGIANSGISRYARTVVINDSTVTALEQALQTANDPNATPQQQAAAQQLLGSGTNPVALLANDQAVVLSNAQLAAFGLTQQQFNDFGTDSGALLVNGQNVDLANVPVPVPVPLVLMLSGIGSLLVAGRRRLSGAR